MWAKVLPTHNPLATGTLDTLGIQVNRLPTSSTPEKWYTSSVRKDGHAKKAKPAVVAPNTTRLQIIARDAKDNGS